MYKNWKYGLFIVVTGLVILIPIIGFSQPVDPPDPDIPIDGGIGFLIAGGAAFGIKKVLDINKKKK